MNPEKLELDSKVVGVLPIVNHFLARLRVEALLDRFLMPLYSVAEWAERISPELLGLDAGDVNSLNDDRIGRALDRLFDADRAALLTDLVVGMVRTFEIALDELHNDSTTIPSTEHYCTGGVRKRGREYRIGAGATVRQTPAHPAPQTSLLTVSDRAL